MSYIDEQNIELLKSKEYLLQRNITLISDFPDDCWLWHGSTSKGYGRIKLNKTTRILAHRMSYLLYVGPIPEDTLCLHTCDESRCCNPSHLFLGTQKDNLQDMYEKGRNVSTAGYVRSEEVRNRMRESAKTRPPISEETRMKMTEAQKKAWKP